MSQTDLAYKAAQEQIAKAKAAGDFAVSLVGEEFEALDRLPPELATLTRLQDLTLQGTQVSDLAPLAGLTGLQVLDLDDTEVRDLAPLAGLTSLYELNLSYTQIYDLAPLESLTGLYELNLAGTKVSDLAPLAHLTSLQALTLYNTQVSDLAPLQALTSLEELDLDGTQVSDLAPLASLTGLRVLSLDATPVSDLAPLQALTSLRELYLDDTEVSDLTPLQALMGLRTLNLKRTPINDLTPLHVLTNLETLSLEGTSISELTPLHALASLYELNLDNTQVSDLAPLRAATSLHFLTLDGTRVSDLAPLRARSFLRRLHLDGTQVIDLKPLEGLTRLLDLRLRRTQVSDLAPLRASTSLQMLSLDDSKVNDLAPLAGLSDLHELTFSGTQVSDLAPLQALQSLEKLSLDGTQVTDLRPIALLSQLNSSQIHGGLDCHDTPATKHDARLAALAQMLDRQERTGKILDYLLSLPPWPDAYLPDTAPTDGKLGSNEDMPAAPEQDPGLPLVWGRHGFAFFANSVSSDPVTEAALDDLRDLLGNLRRKGNQHDDLYRIAGELQDRSAGDISDLNMVKLHLSYQKLRRLHNGRASRENKFDDETVSSMEAVFNVLPGVTLADEGVRVLIERQEAERAAGLSPTQDAAATKVLQDVQDPEAPFAPEVKETAAEVSKPKIEDRLSGTRGILSRNVVVSVVRFIGNLTVAGVISGPVGNFVYAHGDDLLAYAVTMGDDAFIWAQSVMAKFRAEYEIITGITREVMGGSTYRNPSAPSGVENSKK
ncbi:leucine-rich repeat domain-containing protein [Rhodobacteraceae bacterium R_SAG3]|nr:leucine-rich repeat domain-containing protein [Rhodobacteraceae bacterium R_SAG3]